MQDTSTWLLFFAHYLGNSLRKDRPKKCNTSDSLPNTTLLDKLLPSNRLTLQQFQTLLQTLTTIIPLSIKQNMILQHLLGHELGQIGFELVSRNLDIPHLIATSLFKVGNNLLGGVVSGGCQHSFTIQLISILENGIGEFTRIFRDIEEREFRILADRKGEIVNAIFAFVEHLAEIGHEVTWEDERARNTCATDVLFNIGFGVEVRDVGEFSIGCFGDVDQGGEDEVGDLFVFGGRGDVDALGAFGVWVGGFPVVCYEEDCVGAFDCFGD